jgi:hypothetical protein
MAVESDNASDEAPARRRPVGNRTAWGAVLGIVALLIIGAVVVGKKSSSSSTINQGARAVVVPTADAARTVLVPPCGTGVKVASADTAALANTTGTTQIGFPQGQGVRIVLVPKCAGGHAASAGTSGVPSAAFVPMTGTRIPAVKPGSGGSGAPRVADPGSAQSQLTVAAGSPIRTIVVSPCEKAKVTGPAERLLSPTPGSATAVAPPC